MPNTPEQHFVFGFSNVAGPPRQPSRAPSMQPNSILIKNSGRVACDYDDAVLWTAYVTVSTFILIYA